MRSVIVASCHHTSDISDDDNRAVVLKWCVSPLCLTRTLSRETTTKI